MERVPRTRLEEMASASPIYLPEESGSVDFPQAAMQKTAGRSMGEAARAEARRSETRHHGRQKSRTYRLRA